MPKVLQMIILHRRFYEICSGGAQYEGTTLVMGTVKWILAILMSHHTLFVVFQHVLLTNIYMWNEITTYYTFLIFF